MKFPKSKSVNGPIMNRAVLVLNANYSPMTICTAKRAICMEFLDKVEVLASYEDIVRSPSITVNLPSIIKIKDYVRYDNLSVDLNRKNLLERDNNICQYCGVSNVPMTLDHIIPKAQGGKDSWENLVTACRPCNQKKGNKTPQEANISLLSKPTKPRNSILRQINDVQPIWNIYLW